MCYSRELLRALVDALVSGALSEQEMQNRVSLDEWETDKVSVSERRQILLEHITVINFTSKNMIKRQFKNKHRKYNFLFLLMRLAYNNKVRKIQLRRAGSLKIPCCLERNCDAIGGNL